MEVRFYKNKETKEVVLSLEKIEDANMLELKANDTDAALEKHVPVVEINGNHVHAVVGSVLHPMTEPHYIDFIALVTDQKAELKRLDHTGAPEADFELAEGEKVVAVYEFCNLHGLWKKEL